MIKTEINEIINEFTRKIAVPKIEKTTLSNFVRFLYNRAAAKNNTSYGLLVHFEREEQYDSFLGTLEIMLRELNTHIESPYVIAGIKEDEYTKDVITIPDVVNILAIRSCRSSGGIDRLYEQLRKTPAVIKIIGATEDIIDSRLSENNDLRYRIFSREIHLGDLHADEIAARFLQRLRDNGYHYTEDFKEELAYFIGTNYKDANCLDDLMRRIEVQMLETDGGIISFKKTAVLDEQFVPYSVRVLKREKDDAVSISEDKSIDSKTEVQAGETLNVPESVDVQKESENVVDIREEIAIVASDPGPWKNHIEDSFLLPSSDNPSSNILILALSTFPSYEITMEKREFVFFNNDQETKIEGIYQLDPVPLFLKEKGVTLDYVVMLCTPQTKAVKEKLIDDYDDPVSPLEYFKYHLRTSGIMRTLDKNESQFIEVDIELKPGRYIEAIREAVLKIQLINRVTPVNLYIDPHGGLRETQMALSAILSLLKDQVSTMETYSVEFDADRKVNTIVRDKSSEVFNFVSGINEFSNYGRIDSLLKFVNQQENKDLLNPIITISEGIQWCDVQTYENGLRKLKNFYKKNKNISDPLLNLFQEQIRADYRQLIEAETPTGFDVLEAVKWCLRKGFYQQALTLVEAKLPETLHQRGWFELTDYGKKYIEERKLSVNDVFDGYLHSILPKVRKWDSKIKGKIIVRHKFNHVFFEKNDRRGVCNDIIQAAFGGSDLKEFEQKNKAEISFRNMYGDTYNSAEIITIPKDKAGFKDGKQQMFYSALFMHKTLKDIRNKINHANSDNPYKTGAIKDAISYYLDCIEVLGVM